MKTQIFLLWILVGALGACASPIPSPTATPVPATLAPTRAPTVPPTPQPSSAPPMQLPRVFVLNPKTLAEAKSKIAGDATRAPALKQLVAEADAALKFKPVSVVEKPFTPDSGDKHDYVSLSPYWWPDPNKPDGLPYIQKDGQRNPEEATILDKNAMQEVNSNVATLALAFYFTGEENYAIKAAELLRFFYLNPATRMNPNGTFAQVRRGHGIPTGSGIIDFTGMGGLADSMGLLNGSNAWTRADDQAMQKWLGDFLTWLTTSAPGKREAVAANNHGSWYDALVTALALATGKDDLAKKMVEDAKANRIAKQIQPDGKQPEELARTLAMHYSLYNLRALARLASLGERVGVDLWNYQTSDGRSIRKALEFLKPYLAGDEKWTYPQIEPVNFSEPYQMLLLASAQYNDSKLRDLAIKVAPVDVTRARVNLTIVPLASDAVALAKPTPPPTATPAPLPTLTPRPVITVAPTKISLQLPADAIILEAENAPQKADGIEIVNHASASGGKAIDAAVGAKAIFEIEIPQAGEWYAWIRMWCLAESADSYWIGIEGAVPNPLDNAQGDRGVRIYSAPGDSVNTEAYPFNMWFWDANAAHNQSHVFFQVPSAGKYKFWIKGREKGTLLDQIILTMDKTFDAEQAFRGGIAKK
jgi:hypothetical protein